MEFSESSFSYRTWSVSALCRNITDVLDTHFNPVQVMGEVGSFVQAASGHCYFNLKDAQSQIRCAMFRRTASEILSLPANGDRVEVIARVAMHAARGDTQLIVERLRPAGQGAAMEQFLQLKAKLATEGLFSTERKRKLPLYATNIGVVTSLDAAALSDVLITLARRVPHVGVVLAPCVVQGTEASVSITAALEALYARCRNAPSLPVPEVIVLVRGGGAWEDLQAFNDEDVARCIARSPVPLIAGIGHETDFTIADFVADVRAATPTAAAELCAVPLGVLQGQLDSTSDRLFEITRSRVNANAQSLDWVAAALARPDDKVRTVEFRLEQLAQKLHHGAHSHFLGKQLKIDTCLETLEFRAKRVLERVKGELMVGGGRLNAVNPLQILTRGFAWLDGPQGLVHSVHDLVAGDVVRATLADGVVELVVQDGGTNRS